MVLSLAACGKTAESSNTFTMGIDPEYPPLSSLGDDGKYTGFDVEICKAACESLGWDFEVFGVNWDQKLVQLDAKECDCVWSGQWEWVCSTCTVNTSSSVHNYIVSFNSNGDGNTPHA